MTSPVDMDVKLDVNKFNVGENSPYIILKTDPNKQALKILIRARPAGLYRKQDDSNVRFDYTGCLECGTYRVLGLDAALEKWEYPRGTFSMKLRYG